MFNSIYSGKLAQYYELRSSVLSESARKHELCYLKRFDNYLYGHIYTVGQITENFINAWIGTLNGKSSSVENEVIRIRQFLKFLASTGEPVFLPVVPKVHDHYIPYMFTDGQLEYIFKSADNVILSDKKTEPYLVIEFPVILRLLYSCGLRIEETVRIDIADTDLKNGILKLINTKDDKQRLVPLSSGMKQILTDYCLAMGLLGKAHGWLFPASRNESHISGRAVKNRFDKILKDNNIRLANRKKHERGPCLHCLQHIFAFRSFAQAERVGRHLDDAIPYLSIYLGHDSLDETSKYLKFSSELFPETVDIFGDFIDDLLPEVDYEI